MGFDIQRNPWPHIALIATGAVAALVEIRYPTFDLIFRLGVSVVPFAVVLHVSGQYLRAPWLWIRVLPLFALHLALIATFLPFIRQVNIWIWGVMVIAECVVVSVIVARGLPEERAYRNAEK